MRWKDFLYFQRSDRIAIVLLLVLIVFLGSIYVFRMTIYKPKPSVENMEAIAEFESFQKGLIKKKNNIEEKSKAKEQKTKSSTPNLSKLKEGESIELNGANLAIIKRIPGIGDEFALRIITHRDKLGGFVSVDQLLEIKGFTRNKHNKVVPYLRITKRVKQIAINKATEEVLSTHPYISDVQAKSIVQARNTNKIVSVDDFRTIPNFTPRDIDRLIKYISFE